MSYTGHPPKTILVVEDNDLARRQFAVVLGQQGYEVIALRNGQAALDYLVANPAPDLILLARSTEEMGRDQSAKLEQPIRQRIVRRAGGRIRGWK
jgi:CheY-like chemotaxis protein